MGQLNEEWWNDTDSVDAFQFFIASSIRIHIINVLKCNDDPHLTNTSALNEVKSLIILLVNFDFFTTIIQIMQMRSTQIC